MALVFARRPGEGFKAGEREFVVTRIEAPLRFYLRDETTGREWLITDQEPQEVMPEVFVYAGDRAQTASVRVAISAPANVIIVRSEVTR